MPLPTDDDFGFTKGQIQNGFKVIGYNRPKCDQNRELYSNQVYFDYDSATDEYRLILVNDVQQQQGTTSRIIKYSSIYTWKPNDTKWNKKEGEGTLTIE